MNKTKTKTPKTASLKKAESIEDQIAAIREKARAAITDGHRDLRNIARNAATNLRQQAAHILGETEKLRNGVDHDVSHTLLILIFFYVSGLADAHPAIHIGLCVVIVPAIVIPRAYLLWKAKRKAANLIAKAIEYEEETGEGGRELREHLTGMEAKMLDEAEKEIAKLQDNQPDSVDDLTPPAK